MHISHLFTLINRARRERAAAFGSAAADDDSPPRELATPQGEQKSRPQKEPKTPRLCDTK
jgi:hypothetical protein